jgi:hypothetical protein
VAILSDPKPRGSVEAVYLRPARGFGRYCSIVPPDDARQADIRPVVLRNRAPGPGPLTDERCYGGIDPDFTKLEPQMDQEKPVRQQRRPRRHLVLRR